jgi:hypothetical protein
VTFADLVAAALAHLERAAIPYMVTGSIASTYHGEARATRDLDIVIDPSVAALDRLVADLVAAGFYVDGEAARSALQARTQFNAIGPDASKIDFIVRRNRPFSIEEFGRRRPADLLGTPGYIATVEDMVVAKLEWAAATDSERQLRDVAGMLAVGGDDVDRDYVVRWVEALGLREVWRRVSD